MKQLKYEVLITMIDGKPMTNEEMFKQLEMALVQELGRMVYSIEICRTGILVNDEPND